MLRPFTGYLPTSSHGARVVGPPKALLEPSKRDANADDPLSFRHSVGRGAGPSNDDALEWLRATADEGALTPIENTLVVHAATRAGRTSLGVLGDVSVAAYDRGEIKAHEKTIANSEQKMVGYMVVTRLLGNPVVLAHRPNADFAAALRAHSARPADIDFEAIDGTRHQLWTVTGDAATDLAATMTEELYIADGHHRLEAARLLARTEQRTDAWFPAGLYAEDEFDVWAFARGVRDAPRNGDALITELQSTFQLDEVPDALPRPPACGTFGARIDGRSFILTVPDDQISGDAHDRLDVNLLQTLILAPLLGISDPRRDGRLDVIADSTDSAHDPDVYDAWFLPYPTAAGEVMAVADLGRTMPPKSTFFLPKLPGGILIRPL
jgi:uncharacterized protein (DUF1015 family)